MKRGFTLIELLAILVIMVVIAIISIPIILNTIMNNKDSATLASAENYLEAVEFSIARLVGNHKSINDGAYYILENGNICLEKYEKVDNKYVCNDIDKDEYNNELEVIVKGDIPTIGSIVVIENNQIVKELSTDITKETQLFINDKKIIKNDKGNLSYPVCIITPESSKEEKEVGAKYSCEVTNGQFYTFYVLSHNSDGSSNLIMDQNINSDGTPAGMIGIKKQDSKVYNLVSWISKEDYNDDKNYRQYGNKDKGPITAIKFLYEATKNWNNVRPINYTYMDIEYQNMPEYNTTIGYTSFIAMNGIATITSLFGDTTIIGTKEKPLRARLPIYSAIYDDDMNKISEKGDVLDPNGDNEYLYDNLDKENLNPPYGYWTLSSYYQYENYDGVWYVDCTGEVISCNARSDGDVGVRPIITVKL